MQSSISETEQLLTGKQVADILHVSRALAYRLMRENEISVVRIGRNVRVKPSDLDEYIYQHTFKKL